MPLEVTQDLAGAPRDGPAGSPTEAETIILTNAKGRKLLYLQGLNGFVFCTDS